VLRRCVNVEAVPLIQCTHDRVALTLAAISIDVREFARVDAAEPGASVLADGEFLEGLDIAGEEGFEDWLREQRRLLEGLASTMRQRRAAIPAPAPALAPAAVPAASPPLPARIVDLSQPTPGFSGRPALAVLPFRNLTGQPGDDYLAEGLSEDLIDRLSKLRWLPVIARSSSFALAAELLDHRDLGGKLGAKYLLEGRLRSAEGGFALAIDLIDAPSRQVLWSHRTNMPSVLSEAVRAALATELVGALGTRIDHAEQRSAHARPSCESDVNELIWRGRWHFNRLTREDAECARRLLGQALALEPDSVEALVQVTWALERTIWAERGSEERIMEMRRLAQRVISLDPEDSRGYLLAGIAEMWLRHWARAKSLLNHAIELNPSSAHAYANLGCGYNLSGEPAQAITPLTTALRLSPHDQEAFFVLAEIAMAYSLLGHWALAIDYANQSLVRRTAYWYAHILKINACVRSGDLAAAHAAFADLTAAKPKFSASYVDWIPFFDPSWTRHFKEGLAIAAGRTDRRLTDDRLTVEG
jgi:TolB-like protein